MQTRCSKTKENQNQHSPIIMKFNLFLREGETDGKKWWAFCSDVGGEGREYGIFGDDDKLGAFLREKMPEMQEFIRRKLKSIL